MGQKSLIANASDFFSSRTSSAPLVCYKFHVSRYQKPLNALMTFGLIMSQASWRKCVINLSGPGALSSGIAQITCQTSYSVKRVISSGSSHRGRSRRCRLMECNHCSETPRMSSKKEKSTSSLLASLVSVHLSCSIEWINLRRC
jgi:hypothetical protein